MGREAKKRKHDRVIKGKMKIPHSNFINSKKEPMIVGQEIMDKKGTKVKSGGFLSIKIEEGKRAWAKIQ